MYKDAIKRYVEIWWNGIQSFPETTSIHGFRFIADSKRHWIERIFWTILVALSWYGSSLLIAAQYDAFQNNPISFVVETTYKDWDTHFPSVAVCENDNTGRIEEISDGLWGQDHDFNMEEVLKEMAYFKGITYYTSEFCGLENPLPDCIKTNISYYASLIRSPCEEMFSDCSWNNQTFDCCKYFRPMETELGICFAINTLQGNERIKIVVQKPAHAFGHFGHSHYEIYPCYFGIKARALKINMSSRMEQNAPKLPMISNKTTGPGAIQFNVLVSSNVYVLNEEEVPTLTTIGSDVLTVGPELLHRRFITIRNVINDYGARLIRPEKRKCRYSDENFLDVYRHYSYTACTVQCRKEAQIKLCNCTNYFMPNIPEHLKCDVYGIICLNDHVQQLSVLKARWSSRPGLYCDCLPSCTEAEISIMKDFKVSTGESFATVQIELSMLPSERFRRNVVRGILDLVVSTGGTCGLFLGVSILSFVELVYILMVRPFCDIYRQRDDDPWHRKFGTRRLEDNKFAPNHDWSYHQANSQSNSKIKRRRLS